jgi:hypothetical protein
VVGFIQEFTEAWVWIRALVSPSGSVSLRTHKLKGRRFKIEPATTYSFRGLPLGLIAEAGICDWRDKGCRGSDFRCSVPQV